MKNHQIKLLRVLFFFLEKFKQSLNKILSQTVFHALIKRGMSFFEEILAKQTHFEHLFRSSIRGRLHLREEIVRRTP